MRRRVFVLAGEYSANRNHLRAQREASYVDIGNFHSQKTERDLSSTRAFFRGQPPLPGVERNGVDLTSVLASAAHRTLCTFTTLLGLQPDGYREACTHITHLHAATMPGIDVSEEVNFAVVPQLLRGLLGISSSRCQVQPVVGTSDSGAWAFANAVRTARTAEQPATVLLSAGQIIPPGYLSQYQIRQVMGRGDQRQGLDMLAAGDLWMDIFRRYYGVRRESIERLLNQVAQRKFLAARWYPAAMLSGETYSRERRRTPYFDASDIAPPCCGAAAAIVTSDEALVEQISQIYRAHPDDRYERPPLVEVRGVGEGSSNPDLLARKSPILFAPSVRQALADVADDAGIPVHSLSSCAFGVLHDAFPSIELAFLLALGLDWEDATYRMNSYWPNPFGGLVTFGHALGASGLVQVNKAHHIFTGDRRYVLHATQGAQNGGEPRWSFPATGASALITSVGGPMTHIVAAVLHGGAEVVADRRQVRSTPRVSEAHSSTWQVRRRQLRQSSSIYLGRLDKHFHMASAGEAWLVEGVSRVHIRSCIAAMTKEDLDRLVFPEVERYVRESFRSAVRHLLREIIQTVWKSAQNGSRLFLDAYDQGIDGSEIKDWHARGWLDPAVGEDFKQIAKNVKEALQVPLVILCRATPGGIERKRHFLHPLPNVTPHPLNRDDVDIALHNHSEDDESWKSVPMAEARDVLPWWHARARRRSDGASPPDPNLNAAEIFQRIYVANSQRSLENESQWELKFLRAYFAPYMPDAALALVRPRASETPQQVAAHQEDVPAVFYRADIIEPSGLSDHRMGYELIGYAVDRARGWLGMYVEPSQGVLIDRLS